MNWQLGVAVFCALIAAAASAFGVFALRKVNSANARRANADAAEKELAVNNSLVLMGQVSLSPDTLKFIQGLQETMVQLTERAERVEGRNVELFEKLTECKDQNAALREKNRELEQTVKDLRSSQEAQKTELSNIRRRLDEIDRAMGSVA